MAARRPPAGRTPKRRQGRPAAERAAWNADTFRTIYRSVFLSIDDVADALGVPSHTVYSWTAESTSKAPTTAQRKGVAKVLSDATGSTIRPGDLSKTIDRITFRFTD